MADTLITIYGADWCPDCHRSQRFMDRRGIPYKWINIDLDEQAEAFVLKVNRGVRSVPTIVFPDGSMLVEPSNTKLAEKLGNIYDR